MSLSKKVVLTVALVVFCAFSVGGTIMLANNYSIALDEAISQNSRRWRMTCYTLESRLISDRLKGEDFDADRLAQYADQMTSYAEGEELQIADADGNVIFSNLSGETENLPDDDSYAVNCEKGGYYNWFVSSVNAQGRELKAIGRYDITGVFNERRRQYFSFLIIELAVMLCAGCAAYIISKRITGPLKSLEKTARRISAGNLSLRTNIKTKDEIGSLGRSFDNMVRELERQIDNRTAFVADFSHELKTPMTSVVGYADILRTQILDEREKYEYADKIYKNGMRLEALCEKMLSMLELSSREIQLVPVNTRKITRGLEQIFDGERTIKYEIEDARVMCDYNLVLTLLRNLTENAVKASDGSDVKIIGKVADGRYRFCVEDNGKGMNERELSRITEPFFKADGARSGAGNGIGLSICKSICSAFNTQLEITSEVGKGTQAAFYLEVAE